VNTRLTRTLLAVLLVPLLLVTQSIAQAKPEEKKAEQATGVVAVFKLDGPVTETPTDEFAAIFGGSPGISLKDLVAHMRKAETDPNVKAVVVLDEGAGIGIAQTEEVRQAIKNLRAKGKDVYAHCDSIGMRELAMLGGATRLSVVPNGDLWVTGIFAEAPYLRGLLDKLGVQPDFLTCGAYKSAAEVFMRTGPSPEADAMQNWLLDGIYDSIVRMIADGRRVDESKVRGWIDGGPYSSKTGKQLGIIDETEYREDFEAMLRSKYGADVTFDKEYGREKKKSLDLSSPMAIFKLWGEAMASSAKKADKPAVAVVYVDGGIVAGKSQDSPFGGKVAGSTDIRKALDQAASDDSVKAVVLRVDSPGGSATGSEIILEATRRVKAKKPLVVSMGNVAGSGGYYVACASDTIFADENTITGSIGVVAGKLYTNPMWDKVGITFKPYKRGKNAGILSTGETWSPDQKQKMQSWMNEIYDVFKGHVTTIRGSKLKKPIDELAGGRVYTGKQALELGLVDKIGTFADAVAFAAQQAKIDNTDYDVRVVPQHKNFVEKIVEELSGGGDKDDSKYLAAGAQLSRGALVNAALPYLQQLDPQRVGVIVRSLRHLETMQEEGCVLMMPEVVISR
jgi:protease-4